MRVGLLSESGVGRAMLSCLTVVFSEGTAMATRMDSIAREAIGSHRSVHLASLAKRQGKHTDAPSFGVSLGRSSHRPPDWTWRFDIATTTMVQAMALVTVTTMIPLSMYSDETSPVLCFRESEAFFFFFFLSPTCRETWPPDVCLCAMASFRALMLSLPSPLAVLEDRFLVCDGTE